MQKALLSGLGILSLMGLSSCQCLNQTASEEGAKPSVIVYEGEVSRTSYPDSQAFQDRVKQHNPRMIALWGGDAANEAWFQRAYGDMRCPPILWDIRYFFAVFSRYPLSVDELNESGFLPFGFVDPISGSPVFYGRQPRSSEDYCSVSITASEDSWVLGAWYPSPPNGHWKYREDARGRDDEFLLIYLTELRSAYRNPEAMRGALLSKTLQQIITDYEHRRNEMPQDAEDMLDELWAPYSNWALNNPVLDPIRRGSFIFGLDRSRSIAYSAWRDASDGLYRKAYRYSPWPEAGWQETPSFEEQVFRQKESGDGNDAPELLDGLPEDYVPPLVLWKCSLLLE